MLIKYFFEHIKLINTAIVFILKEISIVIIASSCLYTSDNLLYHSGFPGASSYILPFGPITECCQNAFPSLLGCSNMLLFEANYFINLGYFMSKC